MKSTIPEGYQPLLNVYETQRAISILKETLMGSLAKRLKLTRVSAPLIVPTSSEVTDQYAKTQPITFRIPALGIDAEIVQSLNKWKRVSLARYGFPAGEGLFTDMNAIRWDQTPDNTHSVYVDHWAWAVHIQEEERSLDTLYHAVHSSVMALCDADIRIRDIFPQLLVLPELEREVSFVTAQELEEHYPELTPVERENAFARMHHTCFVRNYGTPLKDGTQHRVRRPDTSEWPLSGRLIFWDSVLNAALPVASIGIHVDAESLDHQLAVMGDQSDHRYYQAIREGKIPPSIGGSMGQSRLAMLFLGKAHIGEVQIGVWDQETRDAFEAAGIPLL